MKDYTAIKEIAKQYYTGRDSSCAEAVLRALLDYYHIEHNEKDIHLAAAFGGGMGASGCVCGTLAGALIGFSFILGEERVIAEKLSLDEENSKKWQNAYSSKYLANLLHKLFKKQHHVACCHIITHKHLGSPKERKAFCASICEEVSEWSAMLIDNYKESMAK